MVAIYIVAVFVAVVVLLLLVHRAYSPRVRITRTSDYVPAHIFNTGCRDIAEQGISENF